MLIQTTPVQVLFVLSVCCACFQLKVYAGCDAVTVLYWDEDNDIIPINSQDELSEAFKVIHYNVLCYSVLCLCL